MATLRQIGEDTSILRARLVEKVPSHFGMRHLISAFFGALFLGFSFMLNGLLFQIGLALEIQNLVGLVVMTLIILTAEIYFVGYTRVPDRNDRPFGQFWAKRMIAYYCIALFTSALLIVLYGLPSFAGSSANTLKLLIAVSFPTAIGAALADLVGKY